MPAPTYARLRNLARKPCGFSLIEIAIVVVLIGVIAAIAIPRLSRGTQGSSDTATVQNAAVLQKAIDLYAAEHCGVYPDAARVADQLTLFTNGEGDVSKRKKAAFEFGPYVKKVPALPTGPNKGSTAISTAPGTGVGWVYSPADGGISANLSDAASTDSAKLPGVPGTTSTVPTTSPVN
jgi:general secretion pathway protein G